MSRLVLTKKMLEIINLGMNDRVVIIGDELACDPTNKKELKEDLKTCEKVNHWIYAIRQKRGYNE
jgi:hypothetical protein